MALSHKAVYLPRRPFLSCTGERELEKRASQPHHTSLTNREITQMLHPARTKADGNLKGGTDAAHPIFTSLMECTTASTRGLGCSVILLVVGTGSTTSIYVASLAPKGWSHQAIVFTHSLRVTSVPSGSHRLTATTSGNLSTRATFRVKSRRVSTTSAKLTMKSTNFATRSPFYQLVPKEISKTSFRGWARQA